MPITLPLPESGNVNWRPWAAEVDSSVRDLLAGGSGATHGIVLSPGDSIQAALNNGAKLIYLNPGVYPISASGGLALTAQHRGTRIVGAGQSTIIRATAAISGGLVNISGATDGIQLEGLVLDANGQAQFGLDVNSNGTTGFLEGEPDGVHRFMNLWVYDAITTGVFGRGTDTQATIWERIRVRRAGTYGFHVTGPDNWLSYCEATTTSNTGAGFYINAANTFIHGCKAWYTRGYGFHVQGTRNTFTNCHSQDTRLHGWYVEWDRNTFSSCIADSAAYGDVGGTLNGADGWYVAGNLPATTIQGCMGFDRMQGYPAQQRYGISAPAAMFEPADAAGNPASGGQVRIGGFVGYQNATALIQKR